MPLLARMRYLFIFFKLLAVAARLLALLLPAPACLSTVLYCLFYNVPRVIRYRDQIASV